jgi:hypothetical protein
VERISLVESAHIRQHAFTASALRALPPQAVKWASRKGGGQPFAALTVGSRAVGKRKTLAEMGANDKQMCGQR